MTKENLIKLLKERAECAYKNAQYFKEDRKRKMTERYTGEWLAFAEVVTILENPEFAKDIWNIYFPEEVMT